MAKNFNTLLARMSPENQARVQTGANEMLEELALQELRTALNLTPEQVAEAMRFNQDAGSSPEYQRDIYVGALRKFISALGGQLKLVASFPDRDVVINQFD